MPRQMQHATLTSCIGRLFFGETAVSLVNINALRALQVCRRTLPFGRQSRNNMTALVVVATRRILHLRAENQTEEHVPFHLSRLLTVLDVS